MLLRDRRRFAEHRSSRCSTPAPASSACGAGSGRSRAGRPSRRVRLPRPSWASATWRSLAENLGQPGFRELILRVADLDAGGALPFVAPRRGAHRAAFAAGRGPAARARADERRPAPSTSEPRLRRPVLRRGGHRPPAAGGAARAARLVPEARPLRRRDPPADRRHARGRLGHRPRRWPPGAEQVIVVSGAPEARGCRRRAAAAPGRGSTPPSTPLERQALERDVDEAERINRMVATLGHRTDDGSRAWQDPATGRLYRELALYVIRPQRRTLGPLELGGARDPATEVVRDHGRPAGAGLSRRLPPVRRAGGGGRRRRRGARTARGARHATADGALMAGGP